MKRFSFRLERILDFRQRVERARAQDLGAALRLEEERSRAREAAEEHLQHVSKQVGEAAAEPTLAGTLKNMDLTVQAAARGLDRAEDDRLAAVADVQRQRDKLRAAQMDRRVVDRMKERQKETWTTEASRADRADDDEVGRRPRGQEEI